MSGSVPKSEQNQMNADEVSEAELPEEAQKVIAAARRRLGISLLIFVVGFVAIAGALVYRAYRSAPTSDVDFVSSISLPVGARVLSAQPDGSDLVITFIVDGQQFVAWFDLATGTNRRQISLETQ